MAENFRRQLFTNVLAPVALSVADTVLWRVFIPIMIMRWGLYVTTTINSTATGFVYQLDRRITPASDTGRVNIGEITGAIAEDQAAGKVLRKEVGSVSVESGSSVPGTGTGLVTTAGAQGHRCNVGDEIVFEVVTAADTAAGAGVPFFEFVLLSAEGGDQTDAVDK